MSEDVLPILDAIHVADDLELSWRLKAVRWRMKWRRSGSSTLQGSRWLISFPNGDTSIKPHVIQFQPDGKFLCPKSNKTAGDEIWEYADGVIQFHYNNKYSSYAGRRTGDHKMTGTAHNIKGSSWTWELTLMVDDKPSESD